MVDDPGPPGGLDSFPDRRDRPSGFSGDDEHPDRRCGEIDRHLFSRLGQPERVGRRATDDRGVHFEDQLEAGLATHSPKRQRQVAEPLYPFERGPETDERTKRKRKGKNVLLANSDQPIDLSPTVHKPIPARRRVEPSHRFSGRSGGLVQPAALADGDAQIRPKRRMSILVVHELLFGQQREPSQVVRRSKGLGIQVQFGEPLPIEKVLLQHQIQEIPEAFELPAAYLVSGEPLGK